MTDWKGELPRYHANWRAVGLSTGEANLEKAKPAICQLYADQHLAEPYFWPVQSPLQATILINLINETGPRPRFPLEDSRLGSPMREIWFEGGSPLVDEINEALGKNLTEDEQSALDTFNRELQEEVWGTVGAVLERDLYGDEDSVRAVQSLADPDAFVQSLLDNVARHGSGWGLDKIARQLRTHGLSVFEPYNYVYTYMWGSMDTYWIATALFPHEHMKSLYSEEQLERLETWKQIGMNAFWWIPFRDVCFVSDRPTQIGIDEEGRMHGETGPAVAFSDGWRKYFWHDVEIEGRLVEKPESITVEEIASEDNIERRRVLMEIYGQGRYIEDSGAELIHSDGYGDLYRKRIPDDEDLVMVKVVNSTQEPDGSFKDYWIRVDPSLETAHEAVAWTFETDVDQYRPEKET